MERYDRYKDSGIEWIGEIPEHWSCSEISFYTCSRNGATPKRDHLEYWNGDIPWMASGEVSQGVVLDTKESITVLGLNNSSTELMPIGTVMIALNGQGKTKGTPAILGIASAFNQSLAAFVCDETHLHNRWLYYSFVAMYDYLRGEGTQAQRDGISTASLKKERICLPTYTIQLVFSDYLDRKVSEIENLIRKTEKSIELLQDYRKSVISEAVTKGLDPNVPMKDSGIEWIGEIPEWWDLPKLKLLTTKIGSGKTPKGGAMTYSNSGVLFLRSQNVYNEGLVLDDAVFIDVNVDDEMSNTRVYRNDVLLNITGGSIGRSSLYELDLPANVNQHVCIIRPSSEVLPSFIHYYWISELGSQIISLYQTGANREGLNFEQIGNAVVPFPTLPEQEKIVEYLNQKTSEIDSLIEKKKQLVEKLQEYRKSLISECVTGKVKVPGVE